MEPARILVVDDEAAILRLLKEALTQWGYQVTGATSGAEALQALRGDMFNAVITDIRMPDMNGLELLKEINAKVAPTDSPVLIEGESGTGKELVAAAIHRLSPRAKGPFIPVNCSAIPEDLLESEFFGHVRGAFSGAVSDTLGLFRGANEGTIFLDEVAELSPGLQVKLLRVLQEMQVRPVGSTKAYAVDVRVIAATNRDLERTIAEGQLRQDLYYRLNVVRVTLPPLRSRRDDIPPLVNHFIRRFSRRFRREIHGTTPEALAALQAYDFPGNARELENLIERAFAMGAREQISLTDLPSLTAGQAAPVAATSGAIPQLAEVEKELILRALAFSKDDKEAAAMARAGLQGASAEMVLLVTAGVPSQDTMPMIRSVLGPVGVAGGATAAILTHNGAVGSGALVVCLANGDGAVSGVAASSGRDLADAAQGAARLILAGWPFRMRYPRGLGLAFCRPGVGAPAGRTGPPGPGGGEEGAATRRGVAAGGPGGGGLARPAAARGGVAPPAAPPGSLVVAPPGPPPRR